MDRGRAISGTGNPWDPMPGSTSEDRRKGVVMARGSGVRFFGVGLMALAMIAVACGGGATATGGGGSGLSVRIVSPTDGESVSEPFTVRLDASVPLGDPSTGDHHVHLCFDGASCDNEYTLVYGDSIPVTGLSPGSHTIEASLRNADHSDAGAPTDSITVKVSGTGSSTGQGSNGGSPSTPSPGYGY